jgi:hypothetical protein
LAKTQAARERLGWIGVAAEIAPTLIPGYGDAIGLVGDIRNFIDSPETITPANILASAAGLLPFVPALGAVVRGAGKVGKKGDEAAGLIDEAPLNSARTGSAAKGIYINQEPLDKIFPELVGLNPHHKLNAGPGVNTNCASCVWRRKIA